jgi:5-methylcytosine-specific restriction endonuclease McrA
VRCQERKGLEVDHIVPVARGGRTTADNLRLLCRAHNQYTAERSLGAEFMRQKRAVAINARRARTAGENRPEAPRSPTSPVG